LSNDAGGQPEVAHVKGTIRDVNGRPAVGVQVQAFNKLLRDEESLGTTATVTLSFCGSVQASFTVGGSGQLLNLPVATMLYTIQHCDS
jgi:hypothetical protein